MDLVCSLDDLPFIGDSDVLTLVRVKVHLPDQLGMFSKRIFYLSSLVYSFRHYAVLLIQKVSHENVIE